MTTALTKATSVHVVNSTGGSDPVTVDSRGRLDGTSFTATLTNGRAGGVAHVTKIGDDYFAELDAATAKRTGLEGLLPVGRWFRPSSRSGQSMVKGSSPLELTHPILTLARSTDLPPPTTTVVAGRPCWLLRSTISEGVLTLTVDRATSLPISVALDGRPGLAFDSWDAVPPLEPPANPLDLRGSTRSS